MFLYFLNNIVFFQYCTWIVHRSSQTSSQWSPQRPKPKHWASALLQRRRCATQLVRHTLTNTHAHFVSHTIPFKAFTHTLSSPTHTYKVFLLCCKSTEFLPDPICPPLLFLFLFSYCVIGIEKQYQPLFIWMRIFRTAKHQNRVTIISERLIKQEWSQKGRAIWESNVLMCKAPFTP